MAEKTPLKGLFDGSGNVTGLAELQSSAGDTIGVVHGGSGLATITANKILTGNGTSAMSVEADLTFDGSTNTLTTPNVSISTAATLASAKVSDLTDNRVVVAGTAGELEDSRNLTFDGSTLAVTGDMTLSGNLTVQGKFTETVKIATEDPILALNTGVGSGVASTFDSGFVTERGSSTNVAFIWDESEDLFNFITTTDTGVVSGNINVSGTVVPSIIVLTNTMHVKTNNSPDIAAPIQLEILFALLAFSTDNRSITKSIVICP